MGLVSLKIFREVVRAAVRKPLVGEAEDIVGGNFEGVGQADEQVGIRDGYAAFNAAQGGLGDADFQCEGFLGVTLLHS